MQRVVQEDGADRIVHLFRPRQVAFHPPGFLPQFFLQFPGKRIGMGIGVHQLSVLPEIATGQWNRPVPEIIPYRLTRHGEQVLDVLRLGEEGWPPVKNIAVFFQQGELPAGHLVTFIYPYPVTLHGKPDGYCQTADT